MGRWEPNARGRLEQAALALYSERGFEQTTAAQIAARAGLTERTFFRHYADKREVLFGGAHALEEAFVDALAGAPDTAAPIDAMASTLEAVASFFLERHEFARQRQAVIMANAELRERELIKLASLSSALAATLRRRGVKDSVAALTAEVGIAVFKVGFERWVEDDGQRTLADFLRESLGELTVVATGD
ncbi:MULTISPECIES: TetR family transcriptional regulator [Streptomyces]|uniref:TetR family transcriptional regulator n=2 Tax=Streptomyces TaxID=1883 RepID=A0ABU2RK51_9ACTN|nr:MULTISPECIES: TetR family transcriptional regulator [unclassified Streptomyces]MBK3591873.1 TetR family transcriptional regulator [Streptomyces sp. MBT51]MDT0429215.1 TetR family transcriptional regulator [Streptomyces sp. DSM 41770]HBF83151.1 TetR family transcriptional regulator [Streptomyces sp.]